MADAKTIEKQNAVKALKTKTIGAGVTVVKQSIFKAAFGQLNTDIPVDVSYLGTPIYDNITFGSINDKTANNYIDITGTQRSFTPLRLNEVLIDVSSTNNVIKKAVRGRNGTIKQYISRGDYSILIGGKISGSYSEVDGKWTNGRKLEGKYYPEFELQALVDICGAGYAIPINSGFLNNIFKVDQVVIESYRLPQIEGERYNPNFEINCVSDRDVILEFTEEEVRDEERLNTILGI
jgi:hypothetical protein